MLKTPIQNIMDHLSRMIPVPRVVVMKNPADKRQKRFDYRDELDD